LNPVNENSVVSLSKLQTELRFDLNNNNLIVIVMISNILINFGLGVSLPIFPDILITMNIGKTSVLGLILGSFAIGQAIFAPVIGYLSDTRYGKRRILEYSFFGFSISNFLIPLFINDITIIILIRLFQGISIAGVIPSLVDSFMKLEDLQFPSCFQAFYLC
jgi:MFS family permease